MQLWLLFDNFYIKRKLYSLFKNILKILSYNF